MLLLFWRGAWRSALASLRANAVPVALLQAVALAIVVSYYGFGPTRALWNDLAAFKARTGIAYAAISTAFFAGVLPWALCRLSPSVRHESARHLPWLALFWAFIGCVVDVFYRAQAAVFGDNARPLTVAIKVIVDVFVFSPFFAIPCIVLALSWKDCGYNAACLRRAFAPGWYGRRVVPLLGPAWLVWIPAIALVYGLPLALQLPVHNLVQCLWSLLLLFLTDTRAPAKPVTATP